MRWALTVSEGTEMNITVGKYTLQVIFTFCFIPCWFLLIAGWGALGLPKVFSVVGSSLIIVGMVKLLEKRYPELRKWLNNDLPKNVGMGRLTVNIIRTEPVWRGHRKAYLAAAFSAWLALMLCAIVFGAAWLGDSTILPSVLASVVSLVLLVNHVEERWLA